MNTAWFKKQMNALGVRQEDIAVAIGRDRSLVSKLINNKTKFNVSYILVFSQLLNQPTDLIIEMIGGKDNIEPEDDNGKPTKTSNQNISGYLDSELLKLILKIAIEDKRDAPLDVKIDVAINTYVRLNGQPNIDPEKIRVALMCMFPAE